MLKLSIILVLISIVLTGVNSDQPDISWCNIVAKGEIKLNFTAPLGRYNQKYELSDSSINKTELVEIWVDGPGNIGVARQFFEETETKTYSYYGTNELLTLIDRKECVKTPLDLTEATTPFFSVVGADGKRHITARLSHAFGSGNMVHTGEGNVRGIPTVTYQGCTWSEEKSTTVRYTFSIADGTKWEGPITEQQYPVELVAEYKQKDGDLKIVESIFEFRPYLSFNEEDYFVPEEVFCPGRVNIKELPTLAKRFEFTMERIADNITNGIQGTVTRTKEAYDFDARLFKMETESFGRSVVQIDDFVTGLTYVIDKLSDFCVVEKIDPNGIDAFTPQGDYTNIRNPDKFFDLTNIDYQFSGRRRINGIEADFWIGNTTHEGNKALYEWAFLTERWNKTDDQFDKYAPTPIRFKIISDIPLGNGQIQKKRDTYNFMHYLISHTASAHYDISLCNEIDRTDSWNGIRTNAVKNFAMSFQVSDDLLGYIKAHHQEFEYAAYKSIQKVARVTHLRIQRFHASFQGSHVFFVFEIKEKTLEYGNVPVPLNDVSIEVAELLLKQAVESGNMVIDFSPHDDKFVNPDYRILADKDGFKEIEDPTDGFYTLKTVYRPKGYTTLTVGVASGIVGLVGLILMIVLLVLHKNGKMKLPGL